MHWISIILTWQDKAVRSPLIREMFNKVKYVGYILGKCGINFVTFVLQLWYILGKISGRKLTGRGIDSGSAGREAESDIFVLFIKIGPIFIIFSIFEFDCKLRQSVYHSAVDACL